MKQLICLVGMTMLMLISPAVWSFTPGFASANPDTVMMFIQGHSALVYLSTFFGLGVLLAFTPCVLPMVPILSGIIVGQEHLSLRKSFNLSFAYVMGMAVTYALAGMLAGYMGSTIQTMMQRPLVIIAFSLLFVLMALSMFGLFELRLPAGFQAKLAGKQQGSGRKSWVSVALMGVISTLIVSPCVTAPLIGVLTYIGQQGQVLMGGLILFVMALGMGLPLLLVGAGYGSVLPKTGIWMIKIKQFFGFIMLGIAVWMLGRVLPEVIVKLAWAALLLAGGTVFSAATGRFARVVGLLAIASGAIMAYETSMPVIRPAAAEVVEKTPFLATNTLADIRQQMAQAKKNNKIVFIEFYASWCSDCTEMDEQVYNQPDVIAAMQGLVNLRVDISEKTDEVARIKKAFPIYGTPTMLFFDKQSQALPHLSAVGLISKDAMLSLLQKAHLQQ